MSGSASERNNVCRIMILGGPGAGKTQLARKLGTLTGLPVVHLDRLNFLPGWKTVTETEMSARAVTAARGATWIIEGNYSATWPFRAGRSHLVIFLDMPVSMRLWRLFGRTLWFYGRERDDIGPGSTERFDSAYWQEARDYDRKGRIEAIQLVDLAERRGRPRCVVLRSPAAVRWFLREYPKRFSHLSSGLGHL